MIEVNEYVRTNNGSIFKIVGGNADDYLIDIDYVDLGKTENEDYYWLNHNDNGNVIRGITKSHSHNLIDLIEVGDYVNGNLISEVDKTKKEIRVNDYYVTTFRNENIQTVVTHEQMKSMEYKVGGEDD